MQIALSSFAFIVALLCAGVMGYAIQRGATCTVAAVDEVVTQRTCRRLLSLLEAAVWVAGGLVVAQALHLLAQMPAGYAVSGWTVIGGVLLGLGAYVNGACVFGAIARFGSGEWAYIVTPIGFYLGCLSVVPLFGAPIRRSSRTDRRCCRRLPSSRSSSSCSRWCAWRCPGSMAQGR
jgi:toxin CptA